MAKIACKGSTSPSLTFSCLNAKKIKLMWFLATCKQTLRTYENIRVQRWHKNWTPHVIRSPVFVQEFYEILHYNWKLKTELPGNPLEIMWKAWSMTTALVCTIHRHCKHMIVEMLPW